MKNIWIYAVMIIFMFIGGGCSDDVVTAHEESSNSGNIIIELQSSSSGIPFSSFSRSRKTPIYFSNKVEIQRISSSSIPSSSSKAKKSSSSSKPASSSSIRSSSSIASSSSAMPKSSAALRFYDCNQYSCVNMDYLNPDLSYGEFLDKRDNKVYRTIVISNHVWTAQNMDFYIAADSSSTASWCYDNAPKNCEMYGRLYTWEAAKKVCPEGWHLPTAAEWKELLEDYSCNVELLDDGTTEFDCSGNFLKAATTWNEQTKKANSHGFSVTASGIRFQDSFAAIGETAFFWSARDTLSLYADGALFLNDDSSVLYGLTEKANGLSVRCVKGKAE